jgi:hypothetical protein
LFPPAGAIGGIAVGKLTRLLRFGRLRQFIQPPPKPFAFLGAQRDGAELLTQRMHPREELAVVAGSKERRAVANKLI